MKYSYFYSAYYGTKVFEEDCHFVSDGEVVAAYKDNYWFRAKIIKCSKENVMVFTVDFGDIFLVHSSDIRIIQEEFLILPFQAIECFIQETLSNVDSK
ncbi:RING finger protein 17, partial [Geodia barretti]